MRWILLILLLANGVFFSYQWYLHSRVIEYRPELVAPARVGGESLQLLSEQQKELKRKVLPVSNAEQQQEESVAAAGMCVYLGPFQAEDSARTLYQRLLALGVKGDVDALKVASDPDYWVYMKPLVSREEALRQLKEFQAQKIDSFVVTQGEMENGISLGLFTKKPSAERVLERMIAAGYEVELKLVERFRDEFWVKVTDAQAKQVADSVWDRIAEDYQYIEKEQNLCKSVASSS